MQTSHYIARIIDILQLVHLFYYVCVPRWVLVNFHLIVVNILGRYSFTSLWAIYLVNIFPPDCSRYIWLIKFLLIVVDIFPSECGQYIWAIYFHLIVVDILQQPLVHLLISCLEQTKPEHTSTKWQILQIDWTRVNITFKVY